VIVIPEQATIKDLHEALNILVIPAVAFKFLMTAARTMDFSSAARTIVQTNYLQALEKVEKHFDSVIHESLYKSDDYDKFYAAWVKLFAVLETLINDTLHITNISRQQIVVVVDLLLSYGFDIHQIFDEQSLKLLARNIYRYLRRKGTADLIAFLLSLVGFTSYSIKEFSINRKNNRWCFVPQTILQVPKNFIKSTVKDEHVYFEEVTDPLWWLSKEDMDELFVKYYGSLYDYAQTN
jgi:hypothetical protein